jgi:uncharacterized protein YdhG (YjbR/CyaY superfamily)
MKNGSKDIRSIDEYIATFPEDIQEKLQEVRAAIRKEAPRAEEKITYKMPTFDLNGRHLIFFSAWKHHISLYPIPSGTDAFNQEVSRYVDGKGTLKFPLDQPLPLKLIAQIVKFRVADKSQNNAP